MFPFTGLLRDPTGSSDPAFVRARVRFAQGAMFAAGVPAVVLAMFTDGAGDPVQTVTLAVTAAIVAAVAAVLLLWPQMPDWMLFASFPLATVLITTVCVFDPPLALTPMFYVWPLMLGGYFLSGRRAFACCLFVVLSFGAVSLLGLVDGPRLIQWVVLTVVCVFAVGFTRTLGTRLEELVGQLRELATHDALTGIHNRRAFDERLAAEVARAVRHDEQLAVVVLDIDHFKCINDTFGHAAGDVALQRLARLVAGRLRGGDTFGRTGGEEFAVLLPGADADAAEAFAEQLRERIAFDMATTEAPFTVSLGVATLQDADDAEGVMGAADAAMYRAKRAGRDRVCVAGGADRPARAASCAA